MVEITRGTWPDQVDSCGLTALWHAAANGHVTVVRYLATHGANKEKANGCGSTPLLIAAANGH